MNIFIDLEMQNMRNANGEVRKICKREVIEVGAVAIDENEVEVDKFKTYVRPQYSKELSGKIKDLTGISDSKVSRADKFENVFHSFMKWCLSFDDPVVYAWSESDLEQITKECELKHVKISEEEQRILNNWRDFQKEFDELIGAGRAISLEKAVAMCGLRQDGRQHDAYWDAKNTARIFETTRDKETFQKSLDNMKRELEYDEAPVTLGSIIDFSAFVLNDCG